MMAEQLKNDAAFPSNLPELSPNATSVLQAAVECARDRRHAALGTEHVLWALVNAEPGPDGYPRAVEWMASRIRQKSAFLAGLVEGELEDRPLWQREDAANVPSGALPLTKCLSHALDLMTQFASRPVYDGARGEMHSQGLVASEFILAGILVEGTSVAADILQRLSHGKINSKVILEVIRVAAESLVHEQDDQPWKSEVWKRGDGGDPEVGSSAGLVPWFSGASGLPKLSSLSGSPTATSNWLIHEHLLIGGKPGGYYNEPDADVKAYLSAGVRTFVCLIGEYRSMPGYVKAYPSVAKTIAATGEIPRCQQLEFLYFPIYDFQTPEEAPLRSFVLELKRRILAGELLFIHCLGGHGRTGLVVIPLIMAIFDVDYKKAEEYVNQSTQRHRKADRGYVHGMPETDEQADIAERSEQYVKKRQR